MRCVLVVKATLRALQVLAALFGAAFLLNFLLHQEALLTVPTQHSRHRGDLRQEDAPWHLPLPPTRAPCEAWTPDTADLTLVGYGKVNTSGCGGRACQLNWGRAHEQDGPRRPSPCLEVAQCVTVAVKTRYRYATLTYFITSLWKFYPSLRVVIADEVSDKLTWTAEFQELVTGNTSSLVTYIQTRPGVGLGRHLAAKVASTRYILVVDDDYIVTDRTNISRLLEVIEGSDLDIVAGTTSDTFPYAGTFRVGHPTPSNRSLHLVLYPHAFYEQLPCFSNCYRADIVKTFFLADRKSLLQAGSWDSRRLFYEHEDFFLQMRQGRRTVAVCQDVVVRHRDRKTLHEPSLASLRRASHVTWRRHLLEKWGIEDYYICPREYYQDTDATCPSRKQRHFF